ncbi:hypothetical protein ALC56_12721 [Trachymyrmex septentrionalis]|uniref:Gustatory receptor n=2 Tax=Trachymyrmex septentrionalis TaxID=34720 RepID=A0A195EX98_9HYME|nr:hypothetical protein ALC56_12721 [Trachymyrmex septentrionalis]
MKKRWQLFHATDFQSLMYPCFFYCGILGIFPYKINASNFEISKLRYILVIISKMISFGLQLFSLQILHCKNTFSTKGLTVDATLVAAMVGSITTYMLILIQFLITTHSCDGNLTVDCMGLRNLQIFSLQILHCDNTFSAKGFSIDAKLLAATIGRILGMFPYKINASTFDASKPWYILSTIVICIYGTYNITLIHALIYKVNLGDMTKNLEAIFYYACSGFIMIVTHILSVARMRLLQTILKISSKLPSKSYEKLSRFIHAKDILGTIFVILQMCIYIPKIEEFNFLSVLARVFAAYCNLLVFQTNMLYINCVYVLKACFKNINDNLMHIQRLMVNDTRPLCVSILMGNIKGILLIELKALKKQHLMLITMIHHFTQMILLVWICETGKNQAQQIRIIIHDLLNNTNDKQTKDELHLFSLQLLHCNNTFSAKGFNIDATLFAAKLKLLIRITNYICSFGLRFVESTLTTRILYQFTYYNISFACDKLPIMFNLSSSFQGGTRRKERKTEWRMFHAKDFRSLMHPCFTLCRICGIFPYKINATSFEISKPYLILLIMDMLYMNCVCVLKACFTSINDNLISMRIFIANNESSVHRLNYHNHRNPFLIMELKALKKQHLTISDAVQMLNIVFSLQLLGSVAIILFTITICIYLHILVIYHVVNTNFLIIVLYHALFLLYLGYFFIKILLIVWACETGRAQAQQISISIHDIFNVTTDEKIKDEVY